MHQLDDHGVAEVHQLEPGDVGATVHEALEVDVLKALQAQPDMEAKSETVHHISDARVIDRLNNDQPIN